LSLSTYPNAGNHFTGVFNQARVDGFAADRKDQLFGGNDCFRAIAQYRRDELFYFVI